MTKTYLKNLIKNLITQLSCEKNYDIYNKDFKLLWCYTQKQKNLETKLKFNYSKNHYFLKKFKFTIKKKKKTFVYPLFLSKTKKKNLTFFAFAKKIKKCLKYNKKIKNKKNTNKIKNKNVSVKTNKLEKYSYYISDIFKKIFKNKVVIINFNYFLKTKIKKFATMYRKLHNKSRFFKKTTFIQKILKLTLASLLYKDSKILVHVIKEIFEKTHYSKHKMYFIFWKNFIKGFLVKFYKRLTILGLKLEFHGKLGVGGNSKKRSYCYSVGRCSNSTKLFKIDSTNSFFRTQTGVVGFTYSIFY